MSRIKRAILARLWMVAVCSLYLQSLVYAQDAVVMGQILVQEGGSGKQPFSGAQIEAIRTNKEGKQERVHAVLTTANGIFEMLLPLSHPEYIISIKSLGYKSVLRPIVLTKDTLDIGKVILEQDTLLLNEVRVVGAMKSQTMDQRSYLFTKEQRAKSANIQQLLSTLPGLRLDPMTNKIETIKGHSIMYLINGIPATESTLRSLPQSALKRAIVYDVAPEEYRTSGYLINLIVEQKETSMSGDIDLSVGSLFEAFDPVITYVSGHSMWTLDLSTHLNPKGLIDYKDGTERFAFPDRVEQYTMKSKEQGSNLNITPSLSYLYSGKKVRTMIKGVYGLVDATEKREVEYKTPTPDTHDTEHGE